jgi:hypothetical protein
VDNKSGLQAVCAKVVIDATGDADVAWRAGAPTDPDTTYRLPGLYFAIAGVDLTRFNAFLGAPYEETSDEAQWRKERRIQDGGAMYIIYPQMIKFYREAWRLGEYRYYGRIGNLAVAAVDHGFYPGRDGIIDGQIGLDAKTHLDSGNAAMISELEAGAREYIFETAQFLRRHVPGCERSYLIAVAPYFHFRGGRSIVPEYALTTEDVKQGTRFDDAMFVVYGSETDERSPQGNDFPYRQLLPREVDGLLVAGRAALIQPPVMRDRWKVLLMGQAAGVAAALAAEQGVTPRRIDVKALQRRLYRKYRAPMGDEARLKELGIS